MIRVFSSAKNDSGGPFSYYKSICCEPQENVNSSNIKEHWLGFVYICSEDYELYQNFGETETSQKSDHTSNDKVKFILKSMAVLEEEWFDDMTLTDGSKFPTALVKREKLESIKIYI